MTKKKPVIGEETVICKDCLLPFSRVSGSRKILCSVCAGYTERTRLHGGSGESGSSDGSHGASD
ncbi:MAG: hypothetical protein ACOY93_10325 [Bacillota bacterium]